MAVASSGERPVPPAAEARSPARGRASWGRVAFAAYDASSGKEGCGADDAFAASFQNSSRMSVVER